MLPALGAVGTAKEETKTHGVESYGSYFAYDYKLYS